MKNVGTIVLETSRLLLRRFVENDAQELCEGFVNQKSFLYYANKSEITIQEEIDLLKKIKGRYEELSYYN
ncbi:MAG: hypothetical protein IKE77_07970 [Erysipelotrichaceae bacterium]|nr:hypothetical protein [Erysipelotrichaceae bacterium]